MEKLQAMEKIINSVIFYHLENEKNFSITKNNTLKILINELKFRNKNQIDNDRIIYALDKIINL